MNKQTIQALIVTKGHTFAREPFFEMLDAVSTGKPDQFIHWTHVEHPAAEAVLSPENAAPFDVIVFYDMPGVKVVDNAPPFVNFVTTTPGDKFKENFMALLEAGKPMVFLHHAIASWPTWDEYAEVIGGRFHFLPGELNGKRYSGSGFLPNTRHEIRVEDTSHPVTEGIPERFEMVDELYLMPVLEDRVTPLLRSNFDFTAENFPYGGIDFKDHEQGSNLVGWTNHYKNSNIVYLQFGHGEAAFGNATYRKLLSNAVIWASASHQRADDSFPPRLAQR